jgi:hypothetical protein
MISALRFAGQRLLPIVAPSGGKALTREAIKTGAINTALEQGLSLALTGAPAPLGGSLVRSAGIGLLSGPAERGVLAGVKSLYPGVSQMQGQLAGRLGDMGLKQGAAQRLAGLAAGTGKLGLGIVGGSAIVEPVAQAITSGIIPEQGKQQGVVGDIPIQQPIPPMIQTNQEGMDPEALAHQRRLELIYARNYKFPSYIHHVSSSEGGGDPFAIANQMVNTPTVRYF